MASETDTRSAPGPSPVEPADRLFPAALAIVSATTIDEMLRETTVRAADSIGARHAVTILLVPDSPMAVTTAFVAGAPLATSRITDVVQKGLRGEVCRTNEPLRLTEAALRARPDWYATHEERETHGHPPLRGYLAVPLVGHAGANLGLIELSDPVSGAFEEADERQLASLAQFTAMAIEQLRLHADLAYQSGLTRTVAENATSALLLTDPTGQVTYINSAGRRIMGYDIEELAGRRFHDVVHHRRPDGTSYPMEECPIWRTVLQEERVLAPLEDTFIRPDGTFYPVRVAAAPARRDGRVVGVVIEVQDISAERAVAGRLSDLAVSASDRAAKLRGLIQSIGDAVVVCEPDGSVSLMNPAATELFGPMTHVGQLVGRLQAHDGSRLDGNSVLGGSYMLVGPAREQWLEARVFAVPASASGRGDPRADGRADGGNHGRIHVFRDVTASRRAKVMRETFIGMLSHELRTPITTVYGGAKVLARRSEQLLPEVRSIVADIEAESERLYRLVEDLVVLTKSESASLEAGREPILLQRMVPRLVETEARRWPSIRFAAACPTSLPPVLAEQTYVEQVVRNLLTNAAKYGGSAGTVDVDARAEGGEVIVRVGDRGPGFPGEDAERLFDIYYRSPTVARRAAGAGIGLFVCKSLVEAMGGRIWAGEREGGGAEFSFALPAMAEPADMEEDGGRD